MRSTLAACALALWPFAQPAFAATFAPSSPSVVAGGSFSATLTDSVDVNDAIAGIDLIVSFDPTKLSFSKAENGALTSGWSLVYYVDMPGEAIISDGEPALGPDLGGQGSIVVVDFAALPGASGPAKVTFAENPIGLGADETYQLVPALSFVETVTPRAVGPSVPAPGLACLAIPAIAFGLARRRRRAA